MQKDTATRCQLLTLFGMRVGASFIFLFSWWFAGLGDHKYGCSAQDQQRPYVAHLPPTGEQWTSWLDTLNNAAARALSPDALKPQKPSLRPSKPSKLGVGFRAQGFPTTPKRQTPRSRVSSKGFALRPLPNFLPRDDGLDMGRGGPGSPFQVL